MKKKVLFALIALFSFVSAWAQDPNPNDVTVGKYTVSLDNKLVLIDATTQVATAPTFRTGVTYPVVNTVDETTTAVNSQKSGGVYSYNATTKSLTEVTTLNQVGNYYLQVVFTETTGTGANAKATDMVIYVPFTVGKQIKLWQVYDKLTWDASLADETSFLSSYYRDYPQFEIWDEADGGQLVRFSASAEDKTFAQALLEQYPNRYKAHDFRAQLASQANFLNPDDDGAHPFPYLGFTLTDAGKYKVLLRRTVQDAPDYVLWSDNVYGGAEGAKKRSFVSLATEGSLLENLGFEPVYNKTNPYPWGVRIDNRPTLTNQGLQVDNPNFGRAYKFDSETEYASTLLEAVSSPDVLADMMLIAVPENQPAALEANAILLTAANTTVTITPDGEDDPIGANSKYTYPGVGTTTDDTVEPPTTRGNFTVVVEYNGATLAEGVDYEIEWAEDQEKDPYEDAGTWPIIIKGKGIYTTVGSGTSAPTNIPVNYVVDKAPMTPKDAVLTASNVEYDGNNTDDRAEAVATISYTDEEAQTPKTVTETVEDLQDDYDWNVDVKYVYASATKPAEGEIIEGTELEYPNHVGFWEMRVYFAPEDDDNYQASYVSDIFEVTPTQLAMHLGIINWPFGKDYPEINKLYYSIAKTEYAPGDGTNNVVIEGLGQVWPYEQIGSKQEEIPVGSPVGSYRWNLAPGQEARAVTTIGGVPYENYYVVVHNDNAIINIGKSGLIISVNEDNNSKIYGDEDPVFRPVINNSNSDIVVSYTKDKDGKVIAKDANGQPIATNAAGELDLTNEAVSALTADEKEAIQAELAEMATIYAGVTVNRKGGKGQTPRLEDVSIAPTGGYAFEATLSAELQASYQISNVLGKFSIYPYDITPVAAKEADPATGTPAVPEYTAGRFEITVPSVTYNGTRQTPAVSVIFHHDVLGNIEMYAENDDTSNPKKVKSYTVGEYTNNKNVVRDADWKVVQNQASVAVTADGNDNIYGTKPGLFTVNPAKLTVTLKSMDKIYGENDPTTLLDCSYSGFVTVGEGDAAQTEDYNDPTDDPTIIGKYYGTWEAPTVTRVKKRTPEGEVVGKYAITAEGGKATNYYFDVAKAGQLEIKKKTLTVSATPFKLVLVPGEGDAEDTYERSYDLTYGDHILFDVTAEGYTRNPFLSEADEDLLGEDSDDDIYDPSDKNQEPAYGKITVSSTNAGAFTWDFTNEDGTPELDNYEVVYDRDNNGRIKPNQDGLWLTIEPKSKTYGTVDPELTYVATLDGEEVDLDDLYLDDEEQTDIVLERTGAGTTGGSNAGQYDIIFAEGPATIGNYKVNYDHESGIKAFTINKATLFVKATVVYPQKKDKDGNPVVVDGKPVYETTIPYGQEIGKAYKAPEAGSIPGYAIVEYKNHISGESGIVGSGLIEGDDFNLVISEKIFDANGNPGTTNCVNDFVEYTCDYEDEPNVGKFTVSAEGPEAKNYVISYNDGVNALEVVAAELALKARNQVINYNDLVEVDAETGEGKYNAPAIDDDITTMVQVIGGPLPAGVEIADLVESISCDETSVGTHDIVITPKESELVTVTNYQNGTLTVNPLDEIHLAYENVGQALEDHKGVEMGKIYMPNRNLAPEKWSTFVLPFEVDVPELARQLYYGVADVLDPSASADEKDINFILEMGTIDANEPFIFKVAKYYFKGDENSTAFDDVADAQYYFEGEKQVYLADIFFTNKTIADGDFAYNDGDNSPFVESGNVMFIGTYTDKEGVETDEYFMTANGTFYKGNKYTTGENAKNYILKPTTAYLKLKDAAADVRIFIEEADGTVTEISEVDAEIAAEAAEGWYTITGVKLEGKPATKGTYIYNGKVVYVK